jgi:hypothetical protein
MANFNDKMHFYRRTLASSRTGHLELIYRTELALYLDNTQIISKLQIECAKKVFSIWQSAYEDDTKVRQIIHLAEEFLRDKIEKEILIRYLDNCKNSIEEKEGIESNAGMASLKMGYSIAYENADLISEVYNSDEEADYEELHCDFYASIAYAKGNPFLSLGNIDKRREFWNWYLDCAMALFNNDIVSIKLPDLGISYKENNISREQDINLDINAGNLLKSVIQIASRQLLQQGIDKWEQIELSASMTYNGGSLVGKYKINEEWKRFQPYPISLDPDTDSVGMLLKIRKLMYKMAPKQGAWFTAKILAFNDGTYKPKFNYDVKEDLPLHCQTDTFFGEELKAFPRSKEYTPEWLRKIMKREKLNFIE